MTPANVFATLTNSCACLVFCNVSKSLRLPREKQIEPPKTPRDRQFLTILTSKSFSCHSVVQSLRSSTSKSAPNMQRGAFFSLKTLSRAGVVQILSSSTSKSAPNMHRGVRFCRKAPSRHSVVQILSTPLAADPPRQSWLFELPQPQNHGKTQHFAHCLPAKLPHVPHLRGKTSRLSNIDASTLGGNFQYSRKRGSETSFGNICEST